MDINPCTFNTNFCPANLQTQKALATRNMKYRRNLKIELKPTFQFEEHDAKSSSRG